MMDTRALSKQQASRRTRARDEHASSSADAVVRRARRRTPFACRGRVSRVARELLFEKGRANVRDVRSYEKVRSTKKAGRETFYILVNVLSRDQR